MKRTLLLLLALLLIAPVYGQRYRQSDLKAGNFVFQNRKVHFEKVYRHNLSMTNLERHLKSLNDPSSGMQVKIIDEAGMNGVMIRYQLDWTTAGFRNWKIPTYLRYPINANFEVVKNNGNYRVRVTDIWFSNMAKSGGNQHLTLENMVSKNLSIGFSKKKRAMRALSILDQNLEEMFSGIPAEW